MNGNDYLPGGIDEEESVKIAKYLETLGISCINVSCGMYDSGATIIEPSYYAEGWKKHLGANIRKAVSIPVIAVDNIKHPCVAETLLEEGNCDFVGIARGFLADPDWGVKAYEGKDQLIRKCLGCMECFRILNDGQPLGCTLNPVLGREFEWGEDKLVKNGNGRKAAVIGGGPAGMQSAVVLAKRGFAVTLYEKADKLGGTVNLAAVPPNKTMLKEFIETMEAELKCAGVEVKLCTEATPAVLKEDGAEFVFMTAGGTPSILPVEGIDKAVTAEDVLDGKAEVKGEAVIIGGGVTGLETAETLAAEHKVTVVEMLDKVGGNLYPSVVMHLVQEIMKSGGAIAKGKALVEIKDGEVIVKDTKSGETEAIKADTVILAAGVRSARPYYDELKAAYGNRLVLAGDSDRPGQIFDAMHSAYDRAFVFENR